MTRFEGRQPKPGFTEIDFPSKDLMAKIEDIRDSRLSRKLASAVTKFDLAQIQDAKDVAKAFQAIVLMLLHLGHDEKVRKQCETLIKAVEGYAKHRREYMKVDFPREFVNAVNAELQKLHTIMQPMIKDEYQNRVSRLFIDLTEDLVPDDEE